MFDHEAQSTVAENKAEVDRHMWRILSAANLRKHLPTALMLGVGAALAALSVEIFLSPNALFDGGVVGASMIASHLLPVPFALLSVLLNVPFLVAGSRVLGRKFVLKAACAMVVFSACATAFGALAPATEDPLLATAFGGVLLGIGVGLVLRGAGCLDGTEVVGILANRRYGIGTGTIVLMINVAVYAVAGLMFGADRGMYSLIMYFIGAKVIDVVEMGINGTRSVVIVTEDGRAIADQIYLRLGRTVTHIAARGYVSAEEKDMLYCVITRAEVFELKEILSEVPGSSFATISEVSEIVGRHLTTDEAVEIAMREHRGGE